MIIDTHAQLGIVGTGGKQTRWAGYHQRLFGETGRNFSQAVKANIADMDAAEVDKSVVVAVDAETISHFKVSNEEVAKAVALYPDRLIGFASVDPHKGTLAIDELERAINELGLKGLKIIPHLIELCPNDKLMYPIYQKAQELDIPVLLHTGTQFHTGTKLKYCLPLFVDEVAVDFPELKIIIAHFGYPWFAEAMAIVQRNENVYFNIAGWAPKYIPELVVTHINSVLPNKALFGSDYPLLPRQRILAELSQLNLKQESLNKLLSENAKRLLKL